MSEIPTTIKNEKLVEQKREQIVLAAIKLFAEKGFYKATLRDLSAEARISHGNIYDYIGAKEDIFSLIHEFIADMADKMLNEFTKGIEDPVEKLRQLIRIEFNIMYQWADAIKLLYQETHILNESRLKALLAKERDHVSKFEVVLAECISKGAFREFNVRVIANLIHVMIHSWVIKGWDLRGYATQVDLEKTILDLIFNGLLKEQKELSRAS
jgi:3-oxoacyl-[acyl-carrier protein] reductase